MKQETKHIIKTKVANTFGSFGYLFGFLQWLWAAILYLSVIQSTSSFIFPKNDVHIEQPIVPAFTIPDPFGVIIIVVIIIIMVAITAYALISIPRNIVKTSNKIVYKAAETITPVVIKAQHKHNTQKTRIKLTARLVVAVKLLLVLMPLALTAASWLLEEQSIDYSIAMIVGCGLACFSIFLFATQYLLAKILRVKVQNLW